MKTTWFIAALLVVTASPMSTASSPTGVSPTLVYATYLGSSGGDGPNSWLRRVSLDDSGTLYFAQSTYHTDFPTTANAYSKTYNGGSEQWGKEDLALVEFDTTQNVLKYASYFGGSAGPDSVTQLLRHKNGAYLAGNTGSSDLPVTSHAFDKTFNGPDFRHADGFIARFDDNKLAYLTYLGTSGADWIQHIFVAKLMPTGDKIFFSAFLGGTQDERPPSICLDAANNIFVYANTASSETKTLRVS